MKRYLMSLTAFLLFACFAKAEPLQVGDSAPAAAALSDSGATVDLSAVYAKQPYTLVYFYPRAMTAGCTKQGCSLRDSNTELAKKGVAIIGVSTDTVEKQKEFKELNHFPFTLLADTDHKVMQAFGQGATGNAKREAYLIKDGKIVYKDTGVTEKQGENVLAYLNSVKS
jgi:thioredoxin-dependent peroxiredoxin